MNWEKIDSRLWRAAGKDGMFFIEQKGKTFWGRYASNSGCKNFNMRPKTKLSEAKAQCESNYYWEEEKAPTVPQDNDNEKRTQVTCVPVQQTIPF